MQTDLSKNQEVVEFIKDTYGTPEALTHWLDLAVEMLFYVEEDTFSRVELQEVATALRKIKTILRG